jgi:hypothetical protein
MMIMQSCRNNQNRERQRSRLRKISQCFMLAPIDNRMIALAKKSSKEIQNGSKI